MAILAFTRTFWNDTRGVILPYTTLMLVVIVGVSVLALDGARFMGLQTQMQNGADALALAGAAELDRLPDSITRATNAINNLISNSTFFGTGSNKDVEVSDVTFLRSLPADDSAPISSDDVTTDPTRARFVQVTVQPVALPTVLPASIFGGNNTISAGAQAVAGFDQVLCNSTPLFVCNPFETRNLTYFQATEALVNAANDPLAGSKLLRLAGTQTKKEANGPGDFGYLRPTTGSLPASACGPKTDIGIAQAMAASKLPTCIKLSGIDTQPGEDHEAMDGLNTRFDIYANTFRSCINYAPDQNVRRGYMALGNSNWCLASPAASNWPITNTEAAPLAIDENMISVNDQKFQTLDINVAVGNGVWNCATYWSVTHYRGPATGKTSAPPGPPPPGCTSTATISRYSVYKYDMNYLSDRSRGAETGAPRCSPPGVANRRLVYLPIVNCNSIAGAPQNNSRNVPVAAFGKFFLVLPANENTNWNPYAEFVGLIKPTDKLSHDIVQLYR
jgi:Flp pilus assembly protein TadG